MRLLKKFKERYVHLVPERDHDLSKTTAFCGVQINCHRHHYTRTRTHQRKFFFWDMEEYPPEEVIPALSKAYNVRASSFCRECRTLLETGTCRAS